MLRWGPLGEGCFRCAVDFVLARFGGDPNCKCRAKDGPFCETCIERADEWNDYDSPIDDFLLADSPHNSLARYFSAILGNLEATLDYGMFFPNSDQGKAADCLLEAAQSDPFAFDIARQWASDCLRAGHEMPESLKHWAAQLLSGEISRPRAKGKNPVALMRRNAAIRELVRVTSALVGIPPTSADEESGASACHAVAEALRLLRLQPDSYASVKRIWTSRKDAAPDLPSYLFGGVVSR